MQSPIAKAIEAFPFETAAMIAMKFLDDEKKEAADMEYGQMEMEAAHKAYFLIANVVAAGLSISGNGDFKSHIEDYENQIPQMPDLGPERDPRDPPFIGLHQQGGAPMLFKNAAEYLLRAAGKRNREALLEQFLMEAEGFPTFDQKSKISYKSYGGVEGIKENGIPEEIYAQLQYLVVDWYENYRRNVASSNALKRRGSPKQLSTGHTPQNESSLKSDAKRPKSAGFGKASRLVIASRISSSLKSRRRSRD